MEYILYEQLELCAGLALLAGTPSMSRRAVQIRESIERIRTPKLPYNLFVQTDDTTHTSILHSLPVIHRIADLLCIQCVHFPNNIQIKGALQIVRYIYDVYDPHPVHSISLWIIIPLVCLVAIAILGFVIISVECSFAPMSGQFLRNELVNTVKQEGWLQIETEERLSIQEIKDIEKLTFEDSCRYYKIDRQHPFLLNLYRKSQYYKQYTYDGWLVSIGIKI